MFDYNEQIIEYHNVKVNLPQPIRDKLRDHRKANQNRLMSNIPEGITINRNSFIKQGSYAMWTTIQEKDKAYDIDDGVIFSRSELQDKNSIDMTPQQVKEMVKNSLEDKRFNKKPEIKNNCVRVFYEEGHHVDIPAYRKYSNSNGRELKEIASSDGWIISDPKRINAWFLNLIEQLNEKSEDAGGQLRRIIRLLKRFSKSRGDKLDMPSGIKLTMLVAECFQPKIRDDEAFYYLIDILNKRLLHSLVVENLSDSGFPSEKLTRTNADSNMTVLKEKVKEALDQLKILNSTNDIKVARAAWDWVFQSDGFFEAFDKDAKKAIDLYSKNALISAGIAATESSGRISTFGVRNLPHKNYGE